MQNCFDNIMKLIAWKTF